MIDLATLEFYNLNKDLTWTLPPIPDNLNTDLEIAYWAMHNPSIGWIELDLNIDITAWRADCQIANDYFVDHRGLDHPGWNSCCIHGIDVDKTGNYTNYGYTDESQVTYQWTGLSNKVPAIANFWRQFPVEKYRRIRFMELEPGGYISPHSDDPGNINALEHGAPLNIAVIHPENCHMVLEGFGTVPWTEGKAFLVNIRNRHSVINFSEHQRIHVIGHGQYGNRLGDFCSLIANNYKKNFDKYYNRS
jgi:hypothetical protein